MPLPRPLLAIIAVIAVTITSFGLLASMSRPAQHHPFFTSEMELSGPKVIANRGAGGLWPENTLYAFEQATAMGVDILEMDVRRSADGQLVLIHDSSVERTTNGIGPVGQLTLAELQALDAAYHWSDDGGQTYRYRDQGITVPTIPEVFRTLPESRMNIEMKTAQPALATTLCALIHKHELPEQVLVSSFSQIALQQFREVCPGVATSASDEEVKVFFILNLTFLGPIYSPVFHALQVPEQRDWIRVITPGFVRTAHGRGLAVFVSTMNEQIDLQHMLEIGVDGVVSNDPDQLLLALGRK